MKHPAEANDRASPLGIEPPFPQGRSFAIAAACMLAAVALPLLGWATATQLAPGLVLALLAGLWMLSSTPFLLPPLLALLLLCLFDVVPSADLIRAASGDAALWALASLILSQAARQSGLLGTLFVHAAGRAAPGSGGRAMGAVIWLALALALLPSPAQAARWSESFRAASGLSLRAGRELSGAAHLLARLAWLPAHPANLVAIGLLPSGGLDRFVALHWLLQVWPLLALALVHGAAAQWLSARPPRHPESAHLISAQIKDRFALHGVAGIGLGLAVMTVLQPFHGQAPGQVALLGLVMLFALRWVPAGRFHPSIDWEVLIAVGLLPGLIAALGFLLPEAAVSLPLAATALPLLLVLRALFPALAAVSLAFVIVVPWTGRLSADLLNTALPVLVSLHIAELVLVCPGAGDRGVGWQGVLQALRRPWTWLWVGAYYLWLGWIP
ncbi:MAG: hypothetical protein JZU58_21040 [Curvibacter lanceolatus]|uniref:hypothetical protein n=1 Tax=Curvibacter lanceolatus TaxID=86182 RepID=UPI002355D3A5|nr:hypothetical protein [Curvibacter lanceolatus]MBV5294835.1 hypothetical protein [Curvibacter lanceolatus]